MNLKILKCIVLFISVFFVGGTIFSGCSDDDDNNIVIEQSTLDFEATTGGLFQSTKVITDGDWSIQKGYEDWIIPSKVESNFIVIGVEDNTGEGSREGKVTVIYGSSKAALTVKQAGKNTGK